MTRQADSPFHRRWRRLTLLIGVLIVLIACILAFSLRYAWDQTLIREAYIPELSARASRTPGNATIEALLGARLAQAHRYQEAAAALQRAAGAGENDPLVWELWSASEAASGDVTAAKGVLWYGRRQHVPGIDAAIARCQSLGASPTSQQFAAAACPEGPAPLAARLSHGSFLNGLSAWWGRRHPEQSGYATREKRAAEKPDDAFAQRLWGEALLKNRDIADAGPVLQHALALAPDSPEAHLAMGQLLMAANQDGEAGLQFENCLKLKKDWPPALIGLGQVALDRQIPPLAVTAFRKATAADPKSADAWIGMGRADHLLDYNPRSALVAFQKAASLAPDRTDYFGDYAAVLEANHQADKAETLLRRRTHAVPNDAKAHLLLGRLLLDNRPDAARQREAERELQEALRLSPHSADAEVQLGELFLNEGDAVKAAPFLKSALKDDPYRVTALTDLAKAYQEQGKSAMAQTASRQASALSAYVGQMDALNAEARQRPLDAAVHLKLATLYRSGGEMAKVRQEIQLATYIRSIATKKRTDKDSAPALVAPAPGQ